MSENETKVEEAREKALENALRILESNRSVNIQLVAIQVILNYDIQLRILDSGGSSTKQPTPWPVLGPVLKT